MKQPSKEQVLKASKKCKEVKEVLKDLYPEAFEEEEGDTLTENFKFEAGRSLRQLDKLVRKVDGNDKGVTTRSLWIVVKFLQDYVPAYVYDEVLKNSTCWLMETYKDSD